MSGLLVQSHMTAGQDGVRSVSSQQHRGLARPQSCAECLTVWIDRSHHLLASLQGPTPVQHESTQEDLMSG